MVLSAFDDKIWRSYISIRPSPRYDCLLKWDGCTKDQGLTRELKPKLKLKGSSSEYWQPRPCAGGTFFRSNLPGREDNSHLGDNATKGIMTMENSRVIRSKYI